MNAVHCGSLFGGSESVKPFCKLLQSRQTSRPGNFEVRRSGLRGADGLIIHLADRRGDRNLLAWALTEFVFGARDHGLGVQSIDNARGEMIPTKSS
jgi:hypothetical protein